MTSLLQQVLVAPLKDIGSNPAFFGEVVAAAVRPKPDASAAVSAEELVAFCAASLAKFKVPRYVRFVSEFPMTASGKIQKFKLREDHQKILAS